MKYNNVNNNVSMLTVFNILILPRSQSFPKVNPIDNIW